MHRMRQDSSAGEEPPIKPPDDHPSGDHPSVEVVRETLQHERRNFAVLSSFQIVTRLGWIFKTETIIIPAVLDMLAGSAWLRGCLPLLNRFGQSIPPLLLARRVNVAPRKKWGLFLVTLGMAVSILLLGAMWLAPSVAAASGGGPAPVWAPAAFLILYGFFFACTGLHQLIFQTLQGKLVHATRRGRLLSVSNIIGAAAAVTAAWWLLPRWLGGPDIRVDLIFGFAGVCFVGAALSALLLAEPADDYDQPSEGFARKFTDSLATMRENANFRRLCFAATLSGVSIVLFPHYQALGRERLNLQFNDLVLWVIVQNIGTAAFSLLAGPLADWRGNRVVVRLSLLLIVMLPVAAILLAHLGEIGRTWYFLVFVFLGLTPVTLRLLANYTLEIAEPSDHPRYISTLNLCQVGPALLAPGVGAAIDLAGLEAVFLAVAALNGAGWLLTLKLDEPRHRPPSEKLPDDDG
jgi:hypothetical protein